MDAVDDLRDAIDATRNLLTPVQAGLWLRLAVVVLFVGGLTMGGPPMPSTDPGTLGDGPAVDPGIEAPADDVVVAAAVLAVIALLLWLLFAVVAAIMEFVLIESLRSTEVHVRRYARSNVGRGVRLFGFRLLVSLGALLVGGTPLVATVLLTGGLEGGLGTIASVVLFGLGIYAIYAIVMRFTSEFVAPVMLLEGRGLVGAWRRFWSTVRRNPTEYAVYLLLVWVIQAAVGVAVNVSIILGGAIIAIPFVVLAVVLFSLGGLGNLLTVPVIVVGVLTFVLFVGLVRVPVRSYFKYYALLVLGDTDDELDLITDQRTAIRGGGGPETAAGRDESASGDDRWAGDDESRDRSADTEPDDWEDPGWDQRDSRDENDDRGW